MEHPEYKSFSKVINDALFIALPIVLKRLEGKEEVALSQEDPKPYRPNPQASIMSESDNTIIRLLKETVMNVVINKSMLASVFHAIGKLNKHCGIDNALYEDGLMSDTPDYLNDFEIAHLKRLRQ